MEPSAVAPRGPYASLADVTSEMLDSSGSVLDAESNAVGGSSASGTDYLKSKSGADEIRLTVTDEAGNTTTSTKSVRSCGFRKNRPFSRPIRIRIAADYSIDKFFSNAVSFPS